MKRRVSLYFGDVQADLGEDALVLLNIEQADLYNPAIIRNSYTKEITLPGTPTNNAIFGESFRVDRLAGQGGDGADFNASQRVPFTIYADTGEVLVCGYAKLNEVAAGPVPEYKVTLYGGLGDFIYGLAYDADGIKKTLASLDYLGGGDMELDFTINAQAVRDAWTMLAAGSIPVTPQSSTSYKTLDGNGEIADVTNANRHVNIYDVIGGKKYLISGWQVSTSYLVAAAVDSNGVVLQTWLSSGSSVKVDDYAVTMPTNAVTLRIAGWVGSTRQSAALKFVDQRFEVINFAPAYNGIPDKGFYPDEGLATPANVGLTAPVTDDGTTYDVIGSGQTLVTLPDKVDEWAVRDLRSYLQRPVLNVWKMLQAIARAAAANGWTLDLDDINTTAKFRWRDAWLTRPLLPSIGTFKQQGGDVAVTDTPQSSTTGTFVLRYDLADVPAGASVSVLAAVKVRLSLGSDPGTGVTTLYGWRNSPAWGTNRSVFFVQAVGYGPDDTLLAASPVKIWGMENATLLSGQQLADAIYYTPVTIGGAAASYEYVRDAADFTRYGVGVYDAKTAIDTELSGNGIAYVKIFVTRYTLTMFGNTIDTFLPGKATLYTSNASSATAYEETGASATSASASATIGGSSSLRSGARVTKQLLLSTEGTPADYLLALCKTFGWYLLTDAPAKKVTLLRRNSFFIDETIDLTERVDRSRDIAVVPLTFDAKWYDFRHPSVGGAFADEYKQTEGVEYGIKRVDTNYGFSASAKDLLSGIVLKSAAAIKSFSRYFVTIIRNLSLYIPPVFQDAGCKYTLWATDGTSKEFDVSQPLTTDVVNPVSLFAGYDYASRAEFRDKDEKPLDGADVLLTFRIMDTLNDIKITDDTAAMDSLCGGPCWILDGGEATPVPQFTRYDAYMHLLDFGVSRQVADPGVDYNAAVGVYEDCWRDYMRDRLSMHCKVLRCRVHLDGLQVGQGLLRRFYWYEGSLWALTKISNYSLTTFDPAECEFVQVRDKSNYLAGQY